MREVCRYCGNEIVKEDIPNMWCHIPGGRYTSACYGHAEPAGLIAWIEEEEV